jgi:hypothetical protein
MNFQLYKLVTKFVFRQSSVSHGLPERAFLNPVTRWHCKYLPYPKQVDVSYKRLYGLRMPVRQIYRVKCEAILQAKLFHGVKRLLLQPFRVATVTTMVISTTLATTVTGGVLPGTVPITPGAGA